MRRIRLALLPKVRYLAAPFERRYPFPQGITRDTSPYPAFSASITTRVVERKMRFGESAWRLIQEEAEREGVSVTVYVREAAIARALIERARHDPEWVAEHEAVIARLRSE